MALSKRENPGNKLEMPAAMYNNLREIEKAWQNGGQLGQPYTMDGQPWAQQIGLQTIEIKAGTLSSNRSAVIPAGAVVPVRYQTSEPIIDGAVANPGTGLRVNPGTWIGGSLDLLRWSESVGYDQKTTHCNNWKFNRVQGMQTAVLMENAMPNRPVRAVINGPALVRFRWADYMSLDKDQGRAPFKFGPRGQLNYRTGGQVYCDPAIFWAETIRELNTTNEAEQCAHCYATEYGHLRLMSMQGNEQVWDTFSTSVIPTSPGFTWEWVWVDNSYDPYETIYHLARGEGSGTTFSVRGTDIRTKEEFDSVAGDRGVHGIGDTRIPYPANQYSMPIVNAASFELFKSTPGFDYRPYYVGGGYNGGAGPHGKGVNGSIMGVPMMNCSNMQTFLVKDVEFQAWSLCTSQRLAGTNVRFLSGFECSGGGTGTSGGTDPQDPTDPEPDPEPPTDPTDPTDPPTDPTDPTDPGTGGGGGTPDDPTGPGGDDPLPPGDPQGELTIMCPGPFVYNKNETLTTRVVGINGTLPYNFSVNGGVLPPGLALDNETGEITGTYTDDTNVHEVTFLLTDAAGSTDQCTTTWTPGDNLFQWTNWDEDIRFPAQYEGTELEVFDPTIGGALDLSAVVDSGALPTGLSVGTAGNVVEVTGTASTIGDYSWRIKATDAGGTEITSGLHEMEIVMAPFAWDNWDTSQTIATLTTSASVPGGTGDDVSGGVGSTMSVYTDSGSTPSGVTFVVVGRNLTLGGFCSAAVGTYNFVLRAEDTDSPPNEALTGTLTIEVVA